MGLITSIYSPDLTANVKRVTELPPQKKKALCGAFQKWCRERGCRLIYQSQGPEIAIISGRAGRLRTLPDVRYAPESGHSANIAVDDR